MQKRSIWSALSNMLIRALLCAVVALPVFATSIRRTPSYRYWVGTGIADITGPAADVSLYGYVDSKQTSNGIHMRLFARAFIFSDGPDSTNNRFVFVVADMGMISQLVKMDVIKQLRSNYGNLYTTRNVILSATHTHSATAGYFQYFLYELPLIGFARESHDQYVRGIVSAIKKAHNNIKPAYLYLKSGELRNTQINRSPTSYLKNPESERAMYPSNTDFDMHVLRIDDAKGNPMGMINWYPVHGVSMNSTNRLISGDNKGYASQMFERTMEPRSLAGRNSFIAAFAQAFEGDVSPNTAGPRCIDTGLPCDPDTSTCNGGPEKCIAFGPGKDMFESTKIIGENQFRKALELFNAATDKGIQGPIGIVHKYADMSNITVHLRNGRRGKTCRPAMGYAFAGGTTDGPGMWPFQQHTLTGDWFWDGLRDIIATPTPEMVACHHPKPILLPTGLMTWPYQWQPTIADLAIARIGQLVIVAVSGELTTMSGRRLIAAVKEVFADAGQMVRVVITGLSNVYTGYITTPEEYANQRYEGASTIFGPYTLPAYVQLYEELAQALISRTPVPRGPQPPYLKEQQWVLLPPVLFDNPGIGRNYGDVLKAPRARYRPGETVIVEFVGANPRNSMASNLDTFMKVEKLIFENNPGFVISVIEMARSWFEGLVGLAGRNTMATTLAENWRIVFTDAEWETRFQWEDTSFGTSKVKMQWDIPDSMDEGTYRICYNGHSKRLLSSSKHVSDVEFFSSCSPYFAITKRNSISIQRRPR